MSILEEYEEFRRKSDFSPLLSKKDLTYPTLGLIGEAGEFAEKVKKLFRGDVELTGEYRRLMLLELGDVLWYLTCLADRLDSDLRQVMVLNIEKLTSRIERGKLRGNGDQR